MKKILFLFLSLFLIGGLNANAAEVKIPIELTGTNVGVTVVALDPENDYAELPENPEHIYAAKFTSSGTFQNAFQIKPMPVTDAIAAGCDRIIIELDDVEAGWNFHAYGGQQNYSEIAAGTKRIELMLEGSGDIDDFTIFTLWASTPKVFKVKAAYFYKPSTTTLEFDAVGKAVTSKNVLVAAGGLSYNETTGVLTTDGTAGSLTLEFETPVDLQYLNKLDIAHSGDADIIDRLYFYEDAECTIENQSWGYSKWGGTTDANATNKFTGKTIKKVVMKSEAGKSNTLTATITGITWELKTMSALKGVDITTLPFKNWSADGDNDAEITGDINWWECQSNFNKYTGDVIYGGDGIGGSKRYVDLTSYKKLIIRGYGTIRLFYNWHQKVGEEAEEKPMEYIEIAGNTVDTYELDLDALKKAQGITHFHLVGVKGSGSCYVESISALDGTETADYNISGVGYRLASVAAALADANATCYDATGVTGTGVDFTGAANPNALFIANSGVLSNTKNVIVSGNCANLVLTDNKPFKAPAEFTATTSVSYDRTLTEGKTTTVCLPFALSAEEAATMGKFYALTNLADETLTFTRDEDEISANTPYLFVPATTAFADYASKTIAATPASIKTSVTGVEFIGTLASTTIPASDGSTDYYAFNNGDLVKIETKEATLPAFRGYFKVTSGGGARLATLFIEDSLTGINEVSNSEDIKAVNNFEGKVFENGKIVIFKKGMKFNAAGAQIK